MLPLPNLDNRTFEQLVREARDLIPEIFSEWTDENEHDPGITLLEMLAWHIEMQQFQLDRLTIDHERKFLKLLGESPRDRVPAQTSVNFSNAPHPIVIPYGTQLRVRDLPFETIRPVTVMPNTAMDVTLHTSAGVQEISDNFEAGHMMFYPFGEYGEAGASMVITMKEPLPHAAPLSLWIELVAQEPDQRIPARYKHFTPSGTIVWSYWHEEEGEEPGWRPIVLERDETYGFHQSGPILFELPPDTRHVNRLKAQLVEGNYNDPPYIRRLVWNEVFVKQGQTMCIFEYFDGWESSEYSTNDHTREAFQVELKHALFQQGQVFVQFRQDNDSWIDVEEEKYELLSGEGQARLLFKDALTLPSGKKSIRVIVVADDFSDHIFMGKGTGISHQAYLIPIQPMLPSEFRLQVGRPTSLGIIEWYDWERVYDFDESTSQSLHYIIDEEKGVVRFSDGISGAAPPVAPFPNIRIVGFRTGTGIAGNVKEDTIHQLDFHTLPLQVTNLYPAYGGMEPETVKEAMERTRLSVLEPKCGITAEDMEQRVMEIPGLRIVRVKTIPGYHSLVQNYPEEQAFGHISIVIVPFSKQPLPKPTDGIIGTVRRHLEPYRLLTTTLHVIPPEYIKINIRAIIVIDLRYEGREDDVRQVLEEWLQPYTDGSLVGWEFGKPIYKSDVYDIIHRVPGIKYIQDVWLMAEGKDVYHEEGGDIRIPPNGLAISGVHDIEFITEN